ncbi:MAG: ferrochelatase [Draconibacterium sp.]
MRKGILLVNLGTPKTCTKPAIAKYLRHFLMDERVINIPFYKRWMLVNLIIVPFRTPKVIEEYRKLWTKEGSPLLIHGKKLTEGLRLNLGDDYVVELAMRYQEPSIEQGLANLKGKDVDEIIILPLFPQYASATVGSIHQEVMRIVDGYNVIPNIRFISNFYKNKNLISCFADKISSAVGGALSGKHMVFSYHGVPEQHIKNAMNSGFCGSDESDEAYNYQTSCFKNSELIADTLGLSPEQYSTCFQSRLGKEAWIKPYASDVILDLAKNGNEDIIICSPSFLADCLETTIEIGEQYRELFLQNGGKSLTLVDSLNSDAKWIEVLTGMVRDL